MRPLTGARPGGALARAAAAAGPDAAAEPRPAAQALALRGALPARPDGLRGRRPRGRAAAALVGRGAARRHPRRAHHRGPRRRRPLARTGARGRGRRERGPRVRRGRGHGGGLAERTLVDLDAQAGAGAPARHACASASASGRWTATRASWTTPPATTSATPCGAGRRASGARSTGARWPGTWWTACTTRPSRASARSGWTASPREVPPLAFADDLSRVGGLEFTPWSAREDHTRRLLFQQRLPAAVRQLRGRAARRAATGVGPRRDGVARRQVVRSARRSLSTARGSSWSCLQVTRTGRQPAT